MWRHLFTFLSAASLVLCVATCVLWARAASRVPGGRPLVFPAEPPTDGHFARLDPGGVTVLRTPPPGPQDAAVRPVLLAAVRGATLVFGFRRWAEPGRPEGGPFTTVGLDANSGTAVDLPPADVARPLLDALDDPARFVMAHVVLTSRFEPRQSDVRDVAAAAGRAGADGEVTGTLNGLRLAIRRPDPFAAARPTPVLADPGQIPAVRAYWHARLGRPVTAAPYWALALASAGLPAWWAARRAGRAVVRRRWRAAGLCPGCGYDLRGSSGRCPECWMAAAV